MIELETKPKHAKGFYWREVKRWWRLIKLAVFNCNCKHWEVDEHSNFCIYCDRGMYDILETTKYTVCSYEEDFPRIVPYI